MRFRAASGIVFAFFAVYTGLGSAAPCSGFTDVNDTDSFCPSVDWLKNRSITLGCTSATTFCPTDVVNRAQMALFMNRLGVALTPTILHTESIVTNSLASPVIMCLAPEVMNDFFPRTGIMRATVHSQVDADVAVKFEPVVTSNDGITFTTIGTGTVASAGTSVADSYLNATVLAGPIPFDLMMDYRFALRATRLAGTGNLVGTNGCAITVEVVNRNPSSAPF